MDLFTQQINLNKLKVNALYLIFIHDHVFNHNIDLKPFNKFANFLLIWKYIRYLMTRIWCLEQVMFHEMNVNKKYFWIFGSFEERNERTQLKFKYITSFHTKLYWNKVQTFLDGCSKWHDLFFKSTPKIMSLHFICQCQKQVFELM